ncbi:hypothetical protein [Treponema pectinovorum]|uniref:hypothetical protein n=1 Tax=Treponema pectinovorum TaxID=164 RepID=UPI0011F0E540|nr:hypothetical protein [Treponema pectinovorum]
MRKLRVIILSFAISFAGIRVFAQGYPVIDVANLYQSIEAVYQYYQQIQNTIEQVQNTYKQIEQAAQQMQRINFDDLKNLGNNFNGMADNPFEFITGVRNSAQDITKSVNKQMNKINDLQDSLTKKSIKFGDVDFSVADLCGAGEPGKNLIGFAKNAWEVTVEAGQNAVAGYTGKLTYKQKQAIMKKYGMSPKNYATLQLANHQLSQALKKSNLQNTQEGIEMKLSSVMADAEALKQAANKLPEGNINGQIQMLNSGLAQTENLIGKVWESIESGFGTFSSYISSKKAEEAIQQQEKAEKKEQIENSVKSSALSDADDM